MVAETGQAKALGAKGEIPYLLTPGETYYYADLSGPNASFGTLDYNETPPLVFLGEQVWWPILESLPRGHRNASSKSMLRTWVVQTVVAR